MPMRQSPRRGRSGPAACVRRVFDAAGSDYLKAFAERVVAAAGPRGARRRPGRRDLPVDRGPFPWCRLGSFRDLCPGSLQSRRQRAAAAARGCRAWAHRPTPPTRSLDAIEEQLAPRAGPGGARMKLRIRYNSPVILTFALVSRRGPAHRPVTGGVVHPHLLPLHPDVRRRAPCFPGCGFSPT